MLYFNNTVMYSFSYKNLNLNNINHLKRALFKKKLGEGGFGIIELYQCKQTCNNSVCNRCFVVKRLKNAYKYTRYNDDNEKIINKFFEEYKIGILLNHTNIRRTLDIDMINKCIVFENCSGIDLLDYANEYNLPNTKHLLNYFYQILDGISYLHNLGIAHLDLKLENIIINTDTNVIKLIDFGEAVFYKDDDNKEKEFYGTRGTVSYIPPEVVEMNVFSATKTDMWCCGLILYNLFYNRHPWDLARYQTDKRYKMHYVYMKYNKLHTNIFPINETTSYYTTRELNIIQYLFRTLLNPDPEKRISINMTRSIFNLLQLDDSNIKIQGNNLNILNSCLF